MKKKYLSLAFLCLIYVAYFFSSGKSVKVVSNINENQWNIKDKEPIVIVIDPGHGGRDPGKVGVNNALEKDINLSIALKLKNLLELNDIKIIMTREEDIGLYSETDSNKKNADLRKRVDIIHSSEATFAISIHQNSFGEEYVKGAQVFYHAKSSEGKRLAEIIQEQMRKSIDANNHKKVKANDSYYMLRKTECPLVIVECGYLSNYNEAQLLLEDEYQEKMAWAIHLGIMQYINNLEN